MMMMTKVLHNQIGDMLKVYMDDMIVKLEEELNHTARLKEIFCDVQRYNLG
jgi:hypothetical protein